MDGIVSGERKWPEAGPIRIPTWIYSDEEIFRRELEVFHYGRCWNYVGLECEIPDAGSFKRNWIGPRSLLATRDENGDVHVVENRCMHRGSQLTWKECGRFDDKLLICPYHHWTYDLTGNLRSMPFFHGAKGLPGMPASFDMKEHGLRKLKVATRGGTIWASYHDEPPDFAEYVGPTILPWFDRLFNGKLKLLGIVRQIVPCNWKFYTDNTHDAYHAALLHTFIPKFGLWRPDGDFHAVPTENGRHLLSHRVYSKGLQEKRNSDTDQMRVMQSDYQLADPRVVTWYKDEFGDMSNSTFHTFPTAVVQQHLSSLTVRHIIPKTVTSHELTWNYIGYEDDDDEMIKARVRISNLTGPSGYIAAEDTEIISQIQPVVNTSNATHVVEMGGHDLEPADTMISESSLRASYDFYRREMKL
jgi:anthranilate 1,2-dioxygenase large subunit